MKLLGTLALNGLGMPRDFSESEKQFRRAAQQGDVEAQGILGLYLMAASLGGWESSFAEAVHWLTRSAEAGEVRAMRELGMLHLAYAEGTPFHDIRKGLDWMRRCAAFRGTAVPFRAGTSLCGRYRRQRGPGPRRRALRSGDGAADRSQGHAKLRATDCRLHG